MKNYDSLKAIVNKHFQLSDKEFQTLMELSKTSSGRKYQDDNESLEDFLNTESDFNIEEFKQMLNETATNV